MGRAVRALRAAGVTVVEVPGYGTRGWKSRAFVPDSVVWHHDASPPGDSPGVPTWMADQLDGTGNGAHWWVSRSGVWWAVAALWCPHTGAVLDGMPDNDNAWGVETDHTIGEDWPDAQLGSLRRGTAVLLDLLNTDTGGLHLHKTICKPPGRKPDPDGLHLTTERTHVSTIMKGSGVMDANQEKKLDAVLTALDDMPAAVWAVILKRDDPTREEGKQARQATADRWVTGSRLMLDQVIRNQRDPADTPVDVASLADALVERLGHADAEATADAVLRIIADRLTQPRL